MPLFFLRNIFPTFSNELDLSKLICHPTFSSPFFTVNIPDFLDKLNPVEIKSFTNILKE